MTFPRLGDEDIASFLRLLPQDVRTVLEQEPGIVPSPACMKALLSSAPGAAGDVLERFDVDVERMGRARRIRLMAWIAASPSARSVLQTLLDDGREGEGEGGGGRNGTARLRADVRAFSAALGPRIGRVMVNASAMDVLNESLALFDEPDFSPQEIVP